MERKITLQSKTTTRGARGGTKQTWTDEAVVWAAVRPQSGSDEVYASEQMRYKRRADAYIRHRPDVTTEWRVLYDGEIWDIVSLDEIGRRGGLALKLETGLRS